MIVDVELMYLIGYHALQYLQTSEDIPTSTSSSLILLLLSSLNFSDLSFLLWREGDLSLTNYGSSAGS